MEWIARGNCGQQWPAVMRTRRGRKERVFSTFGNDFEKELRGAHISRWNMSTRPKGLTLCSVAKFGGPDGFGLFRIPIVNEEPIDTLAIDGQHIEPQSSSLLLFLHAAGIKAAEAGIKRLTDCVLSRR